ncbi:hypothetical protein NW249_07895 [Streptomyces sp. OUCMDZ-4982]|uniref:hypothetical protein n=1 Tax=Streptomyces sp. OUCMDZ-4982 TaxID=2973090 RepID=UPI00215B7E5A|nr:hypothetical protein [Streptomyces sp. OUCMDZ-4982]MCR8942040.1 hypothetical protein [Streptomyces sp. OUCMDZ-4982]
MATSRPTKATAEGRAGRALAYLESAKNLTGSACALGGLALTFTGLAGAYWPVVVAGLYGAGALIAPPARPPAPRFPDPTSQLDGLRKDVTTLREYLTQVDLPPAATERLDSIRELLDGLLAPGWVSKALAQDPEGIHVLARAVHRDLPESVDTYVRTRWWTRMAPGGQDPEEELVRQLALLHGEVAELVAGLREAEEIRQQTHTRYLEDRGTESTYGTGTAPGT